MSNTVTNTEKNDTSNLMDQVGCGKLLVGSSGKQFNVEWDADAKVTHFRVILSVFASLVYKQ